MKSKTLYFVFFIVVGLLIAASISFASQSAVWIEGKVTKKPWVVNSQHMIEVDWKPYKIQSDIRITYRYLRNKGAYDERMSDLHSILPGQKIMIKVRKKDVIQIILF